MNMPPHKEQIDKNIKTIRQFSSNGFIEIIFLMLADCRDLRNFFLKRQYNYIDHDKNLKEKDKSYCRFLRWMFQELCLDK